MQKNNKKKKITIIILICILCVVIAGVAAFFFIDRNKKNEQKTEYTYEEFMEDVSADKIEAIVIEQKNDIPTGSLNITFTDGSKKELAVENVSTVTDDLKELDFKYTLKAVPETNIFVSMLPSILFLLVIVAFYFMFFKKQTGGGFGKEHTDKISNEHSKTMFHDVAGMDEEKAELEEVVDFLKTPEKYTKLGAKIPKGVLLIGPPGTGKTLLARAVAGEAGVPFFHISGSEFEEMFVGVGASRVRSLFTEAKKQAPSIIFIDEIDAVARKRSSSSHGNDSTAQTLNQILVEMDGFENSSTIVIAATNRLDILDPALIRPGRFDRKVFVNNPDIGGREAILKLHSENKKLGDDVDLHTIAATTVGFSGAELENLMNEAAIIASSENKEYITARDIDRALIKVGIGTEKKSKVITEKDKKITAFHESGHAILFHLLPEVGPVHMISIVPTGGAGGYTMPLPENDESYYSKTKMKNEIIAAFGGRAAEELIFDEITTGASQDIVQATSLARDMVVKYGMSSIGPVNYSNNNGETFTKPFSEEMAAKIDKEVNTIISNCYEEAKRILSEHTAELHKCAEILLEKEKISREEFEKIF